MHGWWLLGVRAVTVTGGCHWGCKLRLDPVEGEQNAPFRAGLVKKTSPQVPQQPNSRSHSGPAAGMGTDDGGQGSIQTEDESHLHPLGTTQQSLVVSSYYITA